MHSRSVLRQQSVDIVECYAGHDGTVKKSEDSMLSEQFVLPWLSASASEVELRCGEYARVLVAGGRVRVA